LHAAAGPAILPTLPRRLDVEAGCVGGLSRLPSRVDLRQPSCLMAHPDRPGEQALGDVAGGSAAGASVDNCQTYILQLSMLVGNPGFNPSHQGQAVPRRFRLRTLMLLVLVAGAAAGVLGRALRGSPGGTGASFGLRRERCLCIPSPPAFFGLRTERYLCTPSLPALLAGLVGVMVLIVSRRSKS
jgi:hypothetical protein